MDQPAPFTNADLDGLHETLRRLADCGASPGGVVVCGTADGRRQVFAAGIIASECGDATPDEHTVYDIASLTKVVATWPLIGQANAAGLIDLDAVIRDFLPAFSGEAPPGRPPSVSCYPTPPGCAPPPAWTSTATPPRRCTS